MDQPVAPVAAPERTCDTVWCGEAAALGVHWPAKPAFAVCLRCALATLTAADVAGFSTKLETRAVPHEFAPYVAVYPLDLEPAPKASSDGEVDASDYERPARGGGK